jgi:hypothetical protein
LIRALVTSCLGLTVNFAMMEVLYDLPLFAMNRGFLVA